MIDCTLRWSRYELVFVGGCHLAAAVAALQAGLGVWLGAAMTAVVVSSLLGYLRERMETFFRFGDNGVAALQPTLFIAQEFVRIGYRGRVIEAELPVVRYLSEFLIVLRLLPVNGGGEFIDLVLWPDSMRRSEERRLRRYLRFESARGLRDA